MSTRGRTRFFAAEACLAALAAVAAAQDDPAKPAAPPAQDATAAAPATTERQCKVEVLAKGEGREVKPDDVVLAHLVVRLADSGRTLMDTHAEGAPQAFRMGAGRTVPALEQSLSKMRVGDHWKVDAPYELAWGARGYARMIPPRSDVVLDIELVGFLEIGTEVLKQGTGGTPVPGEYVFIHYTAWLESGKQFDDSRKDDVPVLVVMGDGKLIQGWEETLRKMRIGDRVKATIPWQLAYGANGRTPDIPPRSGVVFDIERLPLPEIKVDVIAEGKGPVCLPGREISIHYVGTLPDGKQFDSSRDRGAPKSVVIGSHRAIPGWDLTMVRMRVGDRWKIHVPWPLAYGTLGLGAIPPKTDLVYDIEILSMK